MAQPVTRDELKEWCLRNLGKPVIDINVDDEQLEDRIVKPLPTSVITTLMVLRGMVLQQGKR